jgi:hypothetical protein
VLASLIFALQLAMTGLAVVLIFRVTLLMNASGIDRA